jgi:hypothetical protein
MQQRPAKASLAVEVNRDRFIRIAERRVNKVLQELDNLSRCSNRRNYTYSDKDVKAIFAEIEKKVKDTKIFFQESSREKKSFKLEG